MASGGQIAHAILEPDWHLVQGVPGWHPFLLPRATSVTPEVVLVAALDRLRDTLIHELCHAATWLIHGARDGHGRFWNLYAKKAAMVHPELPVVPQLRDQVQVYL